MLINTAAFLVAQCKNVAQSYKTVYVLGCCGAPLNDGNKARYLLAQGFNRKSARKKAINAATADTFGFDCVGLIKALLWGWDGNTSRPYGGATYASNGVPDLGANAMIAACKAVSADFSNIVPGEVVWLQDHIGVYIGDGLAVECTHRWEDGVQITAVQNMGTKPGYNGRVWTKHGKLPWVTYEAKTVEELAQEVLEGKHGSGDDRKASLGDQYEAVQKRVNEILAGEAAESAPDIDSLAKAVIAGKYGSGEQRRQALGAHYEAVQKRVNELLGGKT